MSKQVDDQYEPEEAARRRDAVVRRMANTPPQPKVIRPRQSRKKAGVGHAVNKRRAAREA